MSAGTWLDDLPSTRWDDLPTAHAHNEELLERLANDGTTLRLLVERLAHDEALKAKCEYHRLMCRLTLHNDLAANIQIRLHIATNASEAEELIPHDHKYPFTARILRGQYTHVWHRRGTPEDEPFRTTDISANTVTVERAGSCYTIDHALVHQTLVSPGTVSLFLRGPGAQPRSFSAEDLVDRVMPPGLAPGDYGQRPMTTPEIESLREQLQAWGLLGEPAVTA